MLLPNDKINFEKYTLAINIVIVLASGPLRAATGPGGRCTEVGRPPPPPLEN